MRVVAYVRAPVYARGYEQHSVNEQRERIERYAGERGWTLTHVYEDAVGPPGTSQDRPALEEALAGAAGFDKLVVTRLDRLTDSVPRVSELLRRLGERGVGVISIDDRIDTSLGAEEAPPLKPLRDERVEGLLEPPPYSAELIAELGLRGLHCGCGRVIEPGWLNTDLRGILDADGNSTRRGTIARLEGERYYLEQDSTDPFPLADGCFEWAYSEHFIEHVPMRGAVSWLREMHRLLKPGGVLRVSTPDLRRYVEGYLDDAGAFFAEHRRHLRDTGLFEDKQPPERRGWMVNQIFYRWGHRWVYDLDEIRHIAERAGFGREAVVERAFGQSALDHLAALDREQHSDESIYVEIGR